MAFGQLYYTSCRTGLSGHPGYQFNAATPGVAPEVMRDVEALTAYEPPRSLAPGTDPDAYPVNLCHVPGDTTMVANVVFVGEDYSRRSGNYFAHALVTDNPRRDLGDRPPIELWRSAGWADRPVEGTELPELAAPPRAAGDITPASVARFLAESGTDHHLAAMLTAAGLAIRDGERKLVIIAENSDTVARWIAALSYALPGDYVRNLSFMTYSGQPRFSRAAVVGALPDVDIDRASGFDRYYLFDLVADRATDLAVHPLARLLAHVGVAQCPDLWSRVNGIAAQAARGADTGVGFAELYPLAVTAADLPDDADAVELDPLALLTWLERAGGKWTTPVLAAVGSAALSALTRDRAATVDQLARLVAALDAVGLHDLLDRAESVLVDTILSDPGGHDSWPALRGAAARQYATDELDRRMPGLPQDVVRTLLAWARRAGLRLDNQVMFHIGHTVVGPGLLDGTAATVAGTLESSVPAREGAVKHVAAVADKDPDRVIEFLAGPTAQLLNLDDGELDVYPALGEATVLAAARRGNLTPLDALPAVARRRRAADRVPTIEAALLLRLWPSGRWTHDEATAVTEWLDAEREDPTERAVIEWLGAAVLNQPSLSDVDGYLRHKELYEALNASAIFPDLDNEVRGRIETLRSADIAADNLLKTKSRSQFDRRLVELQRHMSAGSAAFRQRVEDELLRGYRRIPANFQALVVVRLPAYRKRLFAGQSEPLGEREALDRAGFLWCVRYELILNRSRAALAELDADFLPTLRKLRKRDLRRLQDVLDKQLPGAAATFAQWSRTEESNGFIGRLARAVWSRGNGPDDEPRPEAGRRK